MVSLQALYFGQRRLKKKFMIKDNKKKNAILDSIPLKRLGDPQDISNLAYFFAEEGDYITGQVVKVDGGRSLV